VIRCGLRRCWNGEKHVLYLIANANNRTSVKGASHASEKSTRHQTVPKFPWPGFECNGLITTIDYGSPATPNGTTALSVVSFPLGG
jgi:hypothetical protein